VYHAADWIAVIFNPSFPYRMTHMLLASVLTVSFLLIGLSAWQVLRGVASRSAPGVLRLGLALAAIAAPLQIVAGDLHGLNTLEHQPQKIAAMEGVWETEKGAALRLFAWPDEASRSNRFEIAVPKLGSLILTHSADGEVKGLNEFIGRHPPVAPMFFAFRAMVGVGVLMLAGRMDRRLRLLARTLGAETAAATAPAHLRRDDLRGLGGDGLRLVRHGDRSPAVRGARPDPHGGRRLDPGARIERRPDAHALRRALCRAADRVRDRAQVHGREAGSGPGDRGGGAQRPAPRRRDLAGRRRRAPEGRDMTVLSFDAALPVIFMALMGLSMLVYVVSDGYDLGVGMLMHRATPEEKDMLSRRSARTGTRTRPGSCSASASCSSPSRRRTASCCRRSTCRWR
jgi:hypothetical protein